MGRAVWAVLSAFSGIRGGASARDDQLKLTPLQIVITAIVLFVILIAVLLGVVYWVTR